MRKWLILFIALLPLSGFAEIYKWVDEKGGVHFTDTPVPGATIVNLNDREDTISVVAPAAASPSTSATETTTTENTNNPSAATANYYSGFSIVQPANEETYFNAQGEVLISYSLMPDLRPEDKMVVLLDNKPANSAIKNSILTLTDIDRGEHTLQLQVQDQEGKTLISSSTITFYMRRPVVVSSLTALNNPATALRSPSFQSLHSPYFRTLLRPATPLTPPHPTPLRQAQE